MPALPSRFTFTPPSPAPSGTKITVCFSNPDLANQTIAVEIELDSGSTSSVSLTLNASGNACFDWVAPEEDGAVFKQSTSADVAFVIT